MTNSEARRMYVLRDMDAPRHVDLTTFCVWAVLAVVAWLIAWLFISLSLRLLHV